MGVFSPKSCIISPDVIRDCSLCKEFYPYCIAKLEEKTGIKRVLFDDGRGMYFEEPIEAIILKQVERFGVDEAGLRLASLHPTGMAVLLTFNMNECLTARDIVDLKVTGSLTNTRRHLRILHDLEYIVLENRERIERIPNKWMLNIYD